MNEIFSGVESTASNLEPPHNGADSKKPPTNESIDLSEVLTKEGQVLDFPEFREYVQEIVKFCGTGRKAADALKVNSGFFTQVIVYEQDSPTLRRALNIRKTNRCRLGLDVTPELRAEFHRRRGDMTGGEYLAVLMERESNVD